jgi:Na+/phosphate symporter
MAPRLGHLLYWIASWIAVIVIAAGIVVWLYFAQPNKDPLGLIIVGLGLIVWLGGRAVRYWLAGR